MQVNDRLKIEREKLGLTQIEIAKACGVSYRTYCDYEAGKTEPKASFFAQLDEMGADVMFILTGQYSAKSNISMEEQKLIENYRAMSEESRLNMQAVGSVFAQPIQDKRVKDN
ncbi:helix-turn-helix domain-containing protein [Xenorhabdus cabanillasii]|uniref:Transcriptional regulator, XRE family n=1 Tax=Xenorhabdus cabanillasii JM26 TaxID=1427517 RepID=W1J777_9GAMM|nr:helix-turn-helix transcriptional regulator [Xenorhabdus cabanillasii]PHM76977.1 transcriptional regulator [Xenorhabdus cabanillasii JM26]CDL85716.1 Transcriptional regulator, XRE family [Xenorhabdus cabanillasii JM26]